MLHEKKRAIYMLGTLKFCIHTDQNLVPKPHETLWKSLAPFRMVAGVGLVQPLINRWYRVENQLNRRKYQTIPEKFQIWNFPHPWHVRAWEKFKTNTTMECIWTTETLGAQVFSYCNIRRLVYLCEVCIIRLCWICLKFFSKHVHPNYGPTQDFRFFWLF
jgi:hypothetical protein